MLCVYLIESLESIILYVSFVDMLDDASDIYLPVIIVYKIIHIDLLSIIVSIKLCVLIAV